MFGTDDNQVQNNNAPTDGSHQQNSANDTKLDELAQAPPVISPPVNTISPSFMPTAPAATPSVAPVQNDLLDIKQQALQQLSPLVGQLDQSPEEKFRTTMMMIQASDDQNLVKDAYESAKEIPDEKARAQALLDVINEINYFTQQKK